MNQRWLKVIFMILEGYVISYTAKLNEVFYIQTIRGFPRKYSKEKWHRTLGRVLMA